MPPVPRTARKPTRSAKVVAWRQTYHEVLEELKPDLPQTPMAPSPGATLELVITAATVAASIVAGTDLDE